MAQAFEALIQFDENAEACEPRNLTADHIARTMRRHEAFPSARREVLHRKRKPLASDVDVRYDRIHFLVFFQKLLRMLDLLCPGDVGNVNEPVYAVLDLNEGAEVGEVADL